MIRASFCINDLTMDVDGHAGSTGAGEYDLVCCAASVIAQQLIYCIDQWAELHGGVIRKDLVMDKGKIHLHLVTHDWARTAIKRMIEYCRDGFQMLEDRYPQYIAMTEE